MLMHCPCLQTSGSLHSSISTAESSGPTMIPLPKGQIWRKASSGSVGHSSQGSPQPSPFKAQQHSCLEWFLDLGDEHFPPSNLA